MVADYSRFFKLIRFPRLCSPGAEARFVSKLQGQRPKMEIHPGVPLYLDQRLFRLKSRPNRDKMMMLSGKKLR